MGMRHTHGLRACGRRVLRAHHWDPVWLAENVVPEAAGGQAWRVPPPGRRAVASPAHRRLAATHRMFLPLLPTSVPAGAAAACVENPEGPDNWELGGCKTCAADGESCDECWDFYGLASDGQCKQVRLQLT